MTGISTKDMNLEIHYTSEHEGVKPKSPTIENPETSLFAKQPTANRHYSHLSAPGHQIKFVDLIEIIEDIFGEEYDSKNVNKLRRTREGRESFSMLANNIGMTSNLPVRVF